jgi:hypothetical protein
MQMTSPDPLVLAPARFALKFDLLPSVHDFSQ